MTAPARRFPVETAAFATVGDLVRTSHNLHPQFKVIAVADDRAWIRDIQHDADHVVPIGQCHRIPPEAGLQDL